MAYGNIMLRSVNSMAVGMAIEHRKPIFPLDDVVRRTEVNMYMNDRAMDMYTRRCLKEPFMQYKSEASTVGDPAFSARSVDARYDKQLKKEDVKWNAGSRRPE